MTKNPHQKQFRELVDRADSRQRVADLLSEATGDVITKRNVYRWLADPKETTSARRCPGWAVVLLRQALEAEQD